MRLAGLGQDHKTINLEDGWTCRRASTSSRASKSRSTCSRVTWCALHVCKSPPSDHAYVMPVDLFRCWHVCCVYRLFTCFVSVCMPALLVFRSSESRQIWLSFCFQHALTGVHLCIFGFRWAWGWVALLAVNYSILVLLCTAWSVSAYPFYNHVAYVTRLTKLTKKEEITILLLRTPCTCWDGFY